MEMGLVAWADDLTVPASYWPVNWALPGPCSKKLFTPIWLSSVWNTSSNRSRSSFKACRRGHVDAAVDGTLDQRLGLQRASRNLGGQCERPLVQRLGRHHLVGQADAQRLVGLHLAAGDHHLLGPAGPDQSRQALRAAAAGDDPEQDLRLAEHRPLAGDAVVARQRQLAPAAEGVAADGGDHEPGIVGDGVERGVEAGGDVARLARGRRTR